MELNSLRLLHCGVIYRDAENQTKYLHLAWHLELENEDVLPKGWWVLPTADEDALEDLATLAERVAEAHNDKKIPYAFERADARISKRNRIYLGKSYGLTCASFVALLFEKVGLPLVDLAEWGTGRSEKRIAEDSAVQERLVESLRHKYPEQAALIQSEVGCARLRSEEIAAASGMSPQPLGIQRAEAGAVIVWRVVAS